MSLYPRPNTSGPIEAIVDAGQNVLLQYPTGLALYRVDFVEPLALGRTLAVNLAATGLAAAASTPPVSLYNQVAMPNGQLAQVRFKMLDNLEYTLYQGRAVQRESTLYTGAVFDFFTQLQFPDAGPTEHFIWQQDNSYVIATNRSNYTVNQARIALFGYRYILSGKDEVNPQSSGAFVNALQNFNTIADAIAWSAAQKRAGTPQPFTIIPVGGWGR